MTHPDSDAKPPAPGASLAPPQAEPRGRAVAAHVPAPTEDDLLRADIDSTEVFLSQGRTSRPRRDPAVVLLTGATGYVGAFFLKALLRRTAATIHCMVRAPDEDQARRRLRAALEDLDLWDPAEAERIVAVAGDLAKPMLGLGSARFQDLAWMVDAVYHNGAHVNLVLPYSVVRRSNVLGTREMLRLAAVAEVPFHFVSTMSVMEPESDNPGAFSSGYVMSKWVAERHVLEAGRQGLPVAIYRLPGVLWDSTTGAWNRNDIRVRFIKQFLDVGGGPRMGNWDLGVPVDQLADTVIELSKRVDPGQVFQFRAENSFGISQMWEEVRSFGYPLKDLTAEEWVQRMEAAPSAESTFFLGATQPIPEGAPGQEKTLLEIVRASTAPAREVVVPGGPARDQLRRALAFLVRKGHLPPPPS